MRELVKAGAVSRDANAESTSSSGASNRRRRGTGAEKDPMEIRVLTEEEQPLHEIVLAQAFARGARPSTDGGDADNHWVDISEGESYTCGIFEPSGLQAVASVIDFRIHLGAAAMVKEGGIAAVACLPASRGKGYAGALLKYSLERMRETGHVVSFLGPFSFRFYQQFGWEWLGCQRRYSLTTEGLRADRETECVRAAAASDRPAIVETYRKFARAHRGMVSRTQTGWDQVLDKGEKQFTYTYLYERDDGVEGYLTFRGGSQEETELREFACLTSRAQRGLIGLLSRHSMQTKQFVWNAPENDLLWGQGCLDHVSTSVSPVTMGRIVDVVGALQAWKPSPEATGCVVMKVVDALAPWNSGVWKVEFGGGQVSVCAGDEHPQVSLDIQALSQAYFGTPTVSWLRAAERVVIRDEEGYGSFRTLFDGPPMWLNDHV